MDRMLGRAPSRVNEFLMGYKWYIPSDGSVTKRVLCIPLQSTYECKTRGEEQWPCPPRGEADAQPRHPFHAKMNSRALSKPCLRATFLLRFHDHFHDASLCMMRPCGWLPGHATVDAQRVVHRCGVAP